MNPTATGLRPEKTKIPGHKQYQVPTMGPEQMNLLSMLIDKLGGGIGGSADYLSRLAGGDESMFQDIEKPAYTAFDKLLGNIGTRFSHLGAQDSSYFENATAGAGAELAENLQAQRLGLRNAAVNALLGQSQQLLGQRPYESYHIPKTPKEKTDWGRLIGTGIGAAGGFMLGGPAGGMAGAQLGGAGGSAWGNLF